MIASNTTFFLYAVELIYVNSTKCCISSFADIASPLLLPETPCRVPRQKRFSLINETLDKATPTDEKEKHAFLKVSLGHMSPRFLKFNSS